ncbi:MAG: hypothetical protein EOP33_08205 [Rickettsiaceae bacterium]|nr:MAG: hypothetical protein EOP33_08205 [Rickettsiaceae bacterium]
MPTDKQYINLYNLNEYQIKVIKKKLSYDFDSCLRESNKKKEVFSKAFRNHLDVLIQRLSKKGVKFYGLTFKLPEFQSGNWETIHRRTEEIIAFSMKNIEMIEFMYFSIEKDKNFFQLHCVMGVRSLIGESMLAEIRDVFNQFNDDIVIKHITKFHQIKVWWNFVIKQENFKFHRFVHFSKFYDFIYGSISEHEVTWGDGGCYNMEFYENALYSDIQGIIEKDNIISCIQLLGLYFYFNKFFLHENYIYYRNKNIWEAKNYIAWLDENNIKIFNELKEKFPQQLFNLNINKMLVNYWETVYNLILKKNKYLPSFDSVINFDITFKKSRWVDFLSNYY